MIPSILIPRMNYFWLLFIPLAAFFWAKLEIEIEGAHGWAANLPTWRMENHFLLDIFYGGRPLTGYHVWAFSFVFLAFHLPFIATHTWYWRHELNVIGTYQIFWCLEDYLWFALNPHFGIKKLSKDQVWWHKRWFAGIPLDYWILGLLGIVLLSV